QAAGAALRLVERKPTGRQPRLPALRRGKRALDGTRTDPQGRAGPRPSAAGHHWLSVPSALDPVGDRAHIENVNAPVAASDEEQVVADQRSAKEAVVRIVNLRKASPRLLTKAEAPGRHFRRRGYPGQLDRREQVAAAERPQLVPAAEVAGHQVRQLVQPLLA